jgi:transposase
VIIPSGNFRIFIATEPIDFRKGMDGLVAQIANSFDLDPYDGAIWLFRSRRADRLKLIVWDGTGLVLVMKRLNGKSFVWPKVQPRPVALSNVQFEALFSGIDWRDLSSTATRKPIFV